MPKKKTDEKDSDWRVGSKVPINVYGPGGRAVCQCHNEKDAKDIVYAMNYVASKQTDK